MPSVAVVVLGDIGRSPRMQYHTISLKESGFDVHIVAYAESAPRPELADPRVHIHPIRSTTPASKSKNVFSFLFLAAWKILATFFSVLWTLLFRVPSLTHVLVQNPPSIPTLAVVWFVCLVRGAVFVVDWHNYGFSILGLTRRPTSMIVRIANWYEGVFGRLAHRGFCVSRAMQSDLSERWGVKNVVVLHDRPFACFQKLTWRQKSQLLCRLQPNFKILNQITNPDSPFLTPELWFQHESAHPAVLVSSTSWTPDEDFSLLLDAVELCEANVNDSEDFPNILVVITGKGPLRDAFENRARGMNLRHFAFCTAWLEAQDYPKLLGSADAGVSLHTSSSGLDLPMKVVDMFGCGLPVCAAKFRCVGELVEHNRTGLLFDTAPQLAAHLKTLFVDYKTSRSKLQQLAKGVAEEQRVGWTANWTSIAAPVFRR
eukprot:c15974_g1_i1.p1 GENE.c15974_g1_i1~~c15974_g1_i1.p1  ORF type:complete len:429 (-),score=78.80 c15974_g1_i1:114-1400(-)